MRAIFVGIVLAACSSAEGSRSPNGAAGSAGARQEASTAAGGAIADGDASLPDSVGGMAGGGSADGAGGVSESGFAGGGSDAIAGAAGASGMSGAGGSPGTGGSSGAVGADAGPYTYCYNYNEKWGDCDRDPNTSGYATPGCETNVESSAANCGECGHACPTGMVCQYGTCVCTQGSQCGASPPDDCFYGVCHCRADTTAAFQICQAGEVCSPSGTCVAPTGPG